MRETYPVDKVKVQALVGEYEALLKEVGKTPESAPLLRNLANLYAFQLDDRAKAMTLLEEVTAMPRASEDVVDEAKTTLGDLYLLKGEPWEATLLYSQVEKSHKDSPLGYEAKLRNARLSYYAGDFKLAQSHLDILKEATTREIANDAMQLSLLIQNNTVEDTLGLGLRAYAAVEELVFQNKLKEGHRRARCAAAEVSGPRHQLRYVLPESAIAAPHGRLCRGADHAGAHHPRPQSRGAERRRAVSSWPAFRRRT